MELITKADVLQGCGEELLRLAKMASNPANYEEIRKVVREQVELLNNEYPETKEEDKA